MNNDKIHQVSKDVDEVGDKVYQNIDAILANQEPVDTLYNRVEVVDQQIQRAFRQLINSNQPKKQLLSYKFLSIASGILSCLALPPTLGLSIFGFIPTGIFAYKAHKMSPKISYQKI